MHKSTVFSEFKNGFECHLHYGSDDDQKPVYINPEAEKRAEVTIFSKKSQKRLAWVYANGPWKSMITLTYHRKFPDYKVSKKHLDVVLKTITRMGLSYLWVVEFQGRGFPHYHIWLSEVLRAGTTRDYLTIANCWLRATSDYNDTEESVSFHQHPKIYTDWDVKLNLNYAAKYAEKQRQKWLPIGLDTYGRWWGTNRSVVHPVSSVEILASPETEIYHIAFRRNVRRAIFHWSKRKKKKRYDKQTNCSFRFILSPERKRCILRLYGELINDLDLCLVNNQKKDVDFLFF